MKNILKYTFLAGMIALSLALLFKKNETDGIVLVLAMIGLLLFFTVLSGFMLIRQMAMGREIFDRTITWWWMCAVFLLAISTHRIVSFVFLGFLCFSALREYFSLLPMKEADEKINLSFRDRPSVLVAYLSIPIVIYLAYIEWYELFIIFVPVYVFLSLPIIFVLQNRTTGTLRSIGMIALGLMFFVHNLGHCLFMINMGAMVLVFCFALTEIRDLISFWIGKGFGAISEKIPNSLLGKMLSYKAAPDVSPRKTWATGLVSSIFISALALVFVPYMPKMPDGTLSYEYAAIVGFLIGWAGFFGDLVFSAVKRDIGVKDSASILPGHGGVIDRVDALVFTIPITFHFLYWIYF